MCSHCVAANETRSDRRTVVEGFQCQCTCEECCMRGKCRVGFLVRRTPNGVRKSKFGVRRTYLESVGLRTDSVGLSSKSDGFFSSSDSKKVRRTPIGLVGRPIGVRRTPFGLFGVRINFRTFRTTFRTSLRIFKSDSDFCKSEESPTRTIWTAYQILSDSKNLPSDSIGLDRT